MDGPSRQGWDTLETPERVDLDVDVAGVGSRSLAFLIDALILVVLQGAMALLVVATLGRTLVLFVVVLFVLYWLYFIFFEIRWNGQTPGKRLLGLRVQKVGGYPIGWQEAVIRNVLRPVVDLFVGWLPIGLLVMLFTDRHQRIGDFAAGTVVVRERPTEIDDFADLGYTPVVAASPDAAPGLGLELQVEEFEVLRDLLERWPDLEQGHRTRLADSLEATLRSRLAKRGGLPAALAALRGHEFLRRLDDEYRGRTA